MIRTSRRFATLALAALVWSSLSGQAFAAEPEPAPEPEFVVDPAVLQQTFTKGLALANGGKHLEAAMHYFDVIENGSDTLEVVKNAQFELAVSLYNAQLYQTALTRFEPVVDAGKEHPKFAQTLKYLLLIARSAGATSDVLYKLSTFDEGMYPAEVADELNYLVGLYYFGEEAYEDALARFLKVSEAHPDFFTKAAYLIGVIETWLSKLGTDPENTDPERLTKAAESFKNVLKFGEGQTAEEIKRIVVMAQLALGRLFFSTRQYNVAVRYYNRIEYNTPAWLRAIFEISWVHFQLKDYPRALGNLHTLNSPYFADEYFPESQVLQALILFYNCRYEEALSIVKEFVQGFFPLMKRLSKEITQFADPTAFYAWLAKLSRADAADYSEKFKRIFNAALQDQKLKRKFSFVTRLNAELAHMKKLVGEGGPAAMMLETLHEDLKAYRLLIVGEAGSLAQARLERVLKELKGFLAGALKIRGEIFKAQRNALGRDVKAEQQQAAAVKHEIKIDSEHVLWPFTGEYWKDELGSYIYDMKSKCAPPEGQTPPAPPAEGGGS